MTQYLLSIYQPDGVVPDDEFLAPLMEQLSVWNDDLRKAGAWVFSAGLHPPEAATVVQQQSDEMLVTDGPFTEGKEHVGGFTIIDVEDLDAALVWARRLAKILVALAVEVRPVAG
ncbi:YciI family protein [Kribbella sp. NPDC051770]|uniref:YciI family protein n=1 Tax=Kribbella sp. NPDC051770 TaxID=3155413 RepID=UPI003449644F